MHQFRELSPNRLRECCNTVENETGIPNGVGMNVSGTSSAWENAPLIQRCDSHETQIHSNFFHDGQAANTLQETKRWRCDGWPMSSGMLHIAFRRGSVDPMSLDPVQSS